MKTVNVRDLQKKIRECVEVAQSERVIVTRRGKPAAVLVGVEGMDWESVVLETSESFWKLIEERRRQKTVSAAQLRARVGLRRGARARKGRRPGTK